MRILVGTVEIAGEIPDFADGFRQLGHSVTTVVRQRSPLHPDLQYDVDLNADMFRWPNWLACSKSPVIRAPREAMNQSFRLTRLLWLMARHDVFIYIWGAFGLTGDKREFPLLKKLGKRIVSVFNGSDIRHWSAYTQQCALVRNPRITPESLEGRIYRHHALARQLLNLRVGERYSDLILSVPNQSGLAVRPYMHFYVPMNLSKAGFCIPGRDEPIIVHAPSAKPIKGTDIILSTLERLKSEGVAFELRLLYGVSNQQVLAGLAEADVAIDQLYMPLHGKFGVEAMASGCALATCNCEEFEPIPPNRPIWHIDSANIYEQLKRLLTDRDLRVRLAQQGREYVERYHDHVAVARRIVECLNVERLAQYDHYPTFFARNYRLPDGETIPDGLKRMTAKVVQRWGLPEDVDPQDMIAWGLMSADGLDPSRPIPRWKTEAATVV